MSDTTTQRLQALSDADFCQVLARAVTGALKAGRRIEALLLAEAGARITRRMIDDDQP